MARNLQETSASRTTLGLLGCLIFAACAAFAQQGPSSDFTEGKDLLLHLSPDLAPDSTADKALFAQHGFEHSEKLLLAVLAKDQAPSATSVDWAEMHRALDAIIELEVDQQQLFKASIYANYQDETYRHDERDYVAALAAARRALDLQQRSGVTGTLTIPWKNLGEDLIQLGRIDEAATSLDQAR